MAKNGTPGLCLGGKRPKTAETQPDWVYSDWIGISTRPSVVYPRLRNEQTKNKKNGQTYRKRHAHGVAARGLTLTVMGNPLVNGLPFTVNSLQSSGVGCPSRT
jgi:hypothetical protein